MVLALELRLSGIRKFMLGTLCCKFLLPLCKETAHCPRTHKSWLQDRHKTPLLKSIWSKSHTGTTPNSIAPQTASLWFRSDDVSRNKKQLQFGQQRQDHAVAAAVRDQPETNQVVRFRSYFPAGTSVPESVALNLSLA